MTSEKDKGESEKRRQRRKMKKDAIIKADRKDAGRIRQRFSPSLAKVLSRAQTVPPHIKHKYPVRRICATRVPLPFT